VGGVSGGRWEGGGKEKSVPCLRNDYVVEGGVALAEAGEADFEHHSVGIGEGSGEIGEGGRAGYEGCKRRMS